MRIILALLVLFMPLAVPSAASATTLRTERLEIRTPQGIRSFIVEIADTDKTREQGMMGRKSLAPNRGMLFDFKATEEVGFWMKNTPLSLDIIFIRKNGTIARIAANAVPQSTAILRSGEPVLAVLELAGGQAAKQGIRPGQLVHHRIFGTALRGR